MSGGVDSAVAAGLLAEAGYDVVGITMKMYAPTKPAHAKSCCGADDFDDARRSAQMLGHPALRPRLRGDVPAQRDRALRAGLRDRPHPQPVRRLQQLREARNAALLRPADRRPLRRDRALRAARAAGRRARTSSAGRPAKDQAYALAQLDREQLAGLLLPLGELDKAGDPRPRRAPRAAGGRQDRVAGHLFRRRRRLPRHPRARRARDDGAGRDSHGRRRAGRRARAASPTTPSASGAACPRTTATVRAT